MKKKTQKALIVGLVGISLVALGTTAALVNAKTGAIDRVFTEGKETNGNYSLNLIDIVEAKSTTDASFKQEIKVEDVNSPFAEIVVEYTTYADNDHPAAVVVEENVTCSYVEEVKLTFTLKENVDYYVGSLGLLDFDFTNPDETEDLEYSVKVGNHDYDGYLFSDEKLFVNKNTYSDDIVVTIKNPLAKEKKTVEGKFTLGFISFNYLDSESYTAPSISE